MEDYDKGSARLIAALINAQQEDCARLSRLLHDEVGQTLTAVGLQLELLRLDFREQLPAIDTRVATIQELLETAIARIRNMSYALDPALVEKAGLAFALEQLVGRYRQRFEGPLRLMVDLRERLPNDVANALYKIADQALANAVQHARSPRIEVLVHPSVDGTVLEVRDWGVGFSAQPADEKIRGLGVVLMEHFAAQADIRLSVESAPGQGTVVRATCPHEAAPGQVSRD